jgi:hypothetical protein
MWLLAYATIGRAAIDLILALRGRRYNTERRRGCRMLGGKGRGGDLLRKRGDGFIMMLGAG